MVLALVVVAGCGATRLVFPVALDPHALAVPSDRRVLGSHDAVVRAVAAILMKDLRLPLPGEVTVFVYSSREGFEQGLIHDAKLSAARAAELSEFAVGVGRRGQLLLRDAKTGALAREWVRLVAHELTHVAQIELAQSEGRAEQWLAEGMSEWVAFRVLERLELDTMTRRRRAAAAGIRSHAALRAARLDLDTLGTPRGFTTRHLRDGSLPTYQLAFLMADYLIERQGFEQVVGYYRSFAKGGRRREAFARAFGRSLPAFEEEVLVHLQTLVR